MTLLTVKYLLLFASLAAFVAFMKWSLRSGKLMEWLTALCLARLDKRLFRVFNDVLLPDGEGGTTQVDHIVVCSGGLYCVESKGWGGKLGAARCKIYARAEERQWKIYYKGKRGRALGAAFVPNPLRQNHKHHLCLSQALGIPPETIHPMVVLPGFCQLMKSEAIEGLFLGALELRDAIRRQAHGKVFPPKTLQDILLRLERHKTASTAKANKAHVQRLREKFSSDVCPRCGAKLVRRVGKKNGAPFLGCSTFPACRYTHALDTPKE